MFDPPPQPSVSHENAYSDALSSQWMAILEWTRTALVARGWPTGTIIKGETVDSERIHDFQRKHGIQLPKDLVNTLSQFAGSISTDFPWPSDGTEELAKWNAFQDRPKGVMFGGEVQHLWSFDLLDERYEEFADFSEPYIDEDDEFGRPFRDTVPLVEAGNGDWIALNHRTSVVYYLSHDGDAEMNGNRLGISFVDFITRWTWACVPWPDYLPDQMVYDTDAQEIPIACDGLSLWHAWLRGEDSVATQGEPESR